MTVQKASFSAVARMILTAVYTFAAVIMQCSMFPHLRLFGVIPELVLCVIVCVSCFENEKFCCVLAVCAGFLLDTAGGDLYTFSPVIFLLAACLSIVISKRVFSRKLIPASISAAAALTAGAAKTYIILLGSGAPALPALLNTALPQLLYGAIIFMPVFLLTALHHRIFREKNDQVRKFAR